MQQFRTINASNPFGCLIAVLLLLAGLVVLFFVFIINAVLSIFNLELPVQKWLMRMIFGKAGQKGSQGPDNSGWDSSQTSSSAGQGKIEEPDESEYVDFKEVE